MIIPTNEQLVDIMLTHLSGLSECERYNFAVELIEKIATIAGCDRWEKLQIISDAQYLLICSIVGKQRKQHKQDE